MKQKNIASFIVIFWAGFVSAISFMEAWLKFQAPGITVPLGLGIGRLVFGAMNYVEWILLLGFLLTVFVSAKKRKFENRKTWILLTLVAIILFLQTFWMLPVLDERAALIIAGKEPPKSMLHIFYIAAEFIKVISLILLAFAIQKEKFQRSI